MSNKPGGLLRAGGRRKSTPTSPTSPTLHRKLNASPDVFFPPDSTPAESPSIDITVPSPTFDLSSVSPTLAAGNRFAQRPHPSNRASDDFGKSRPKFLAETTRPSTSSAEGSGWSTAQPRYTRSPDQPSSRDSPSFLPRLSSEGSGRSSSREHQDAAAATPLRSTTSNLQHDRSASDDATATKGAASTKKSRFSLKSPMNLWGRRRSSQGANKLDDGSISSVKMHVAPMPDNIDPSIRGSIVHDFSTPRNRRIDSSPRTAPLPSPSYPRRPSENSSPSLAPSIGTPTASHNFIFKEHFQEEKGPVQPASTAYHNQAFHLRSSGQVPTFAKRLPPNVPDENGELSSPVREPSHETEAEASVASTLSTEPDVPPPSTPHLLSSPPLPPTLVEEPPSPVLDMPPADALPKHMTSTSSRFSFQINQQGSNAQEKFLEDKHKEHALKRPAAIRLSVASMDDLDDYDYENMDDEDCFDNEDIVVKNIDLPSSQHIDNFASAVEEDYGDSGDEDNFEAVDDENDYGTEDIVIRNIDMPTSQNEGRQGYENSDYTKRQSLQAFHFTPQSLSFSPGTVQYTSTSTPRDFEGYPIGKAETQDGGVYNIRPQIRDSFDQSPDAVFFEGLGISTVTNVLPVTEHIAPQQPSFDDLYFDDGEFGDGIADIDADFTEDMLDDAKRIRDIPAENARRLEAALQASSSDHNIKAISHVDQSDPFRTTSRTPSLRIESPELHHKEYAENSSKDLTEGNLAAYHDALAQAATQAAASGKFDRVVSFSRMSDDETDSPFHNSIPALSSRGSKYSNNMIEVGVSDLDGFDDDMDDEAMIAAANAELLENDDDGIYGQEFGFYARSHGKDSVEFASGGYFTSRGSNGIKRSHSGKNNFQEPSLTPITEISEMASARNSVASLPHYTGIQGGLQSLSSPAGTLADLIERDRLIVNDDMSLHALFKLRSRTFGGSSTSVNSMSDRNYPHSSPLAHLSGFSMGPTDTFTGKLSSPAVGRRSMSIAESEDEEEDWGRTTLTQNTPHKKHPELVSQSSHDQTPSSPLARKGHHSRNSSGAESVSYVRDADGRWFQERTRKGENGEIESVERELCQV